MSRPDVRTTLFTAVRQLHVPTMLFTAVVALLIVLAVAFVLLIPPVAIPLD